MVSLASPSATAPASFSPSLLRTGNTRLSSAAHYSLDLSARASNRLTLSRQIKMNTTKSRRSLTVGCEYGGGSKGGSGGDFFAGFLLGGALFGTMAYIFAPQIRKSLLIEDEHGFRRGHRPYYYGEGFETTQHTLNEKISQLNSAIDKVTSSLRGRGSDKSTKEEDMYRDIGI